MSEGVTFNNIKDVNEYRTKLAKDGIASYIKKRGDKFIVTIDIGKPTEIFLGDKPEDNSWSNTFGKEIHVNPEYPEQLPTILGHEIAHNKLKHVNLVEDIGTIKELNREIEAWEETIKKGKSNIDKNIVKQKLWNYYNYIDDEYDKEAKQKINEFSQKYYNENWIE